MMMMAMNVVQLFQVYADKWISSIKVQSKNADYYRGKCVVS